MAQYFKNNEMYTPFVKLILIVVMASGMYKAWKWFCYRLDKLEDKSICKINRKLAFSEIGNANFLISV